MGLYGEDLAAIHAAGFTAIASAAAAELLPRLAPGSRVLELGWDLMPAAKPRQGG